MSDAREIGREPCAAREPQRDQSRDLRSRRRHQFRDAPHLVRARRLRQLRARRAFRVVRKR
jgi:hypothetical protein